MEHVNNFSCYTWGEGRTGNGQFVNFSCRPEEVDQVKEFLKKIRTIDIPTTGRVVVSHGGYGEYTRYDIKQHDYASGGPGDGGGWSLIEVLEIKNPPDGRWGIVIHEDGSSRGAVFTEWETIEDAREVFKKHLGMFDESLDFRKKLKGFRRQVICGQMRPWFYAIGDEELIGDYAFPEGLQDDPIYRFGKKFVVYDKDYMPTIKTCMGTRFLKEEDSNSGKNSYYRLIYWDDGSVYYPHDWNSYKPRPLEDGEIWIDEAFQQFKKFLTGKTKEFFINFINGGKFIGKLAKTKDYVPCAEGNYYLVVKIKNKEKVMEGWVNDFKPTQDDPDIIQYVTNRLIKGGITKEEIEKITIKESKTKKGGKKWSGVFFNPAKA